MSDVLDLGTLSEESKRRIAEAAAAEPKEVITAFVVTLGLDGQWTVDVDFDTPLSIRRQITGDDLVAASAVLHKDVLVNEVSVRVPAVISQIAQNQMEQRQGQRIMQGLDLPR